MVGRVLPLSLSVHFPEEWQPCILLWQGSVCPFSPWVGDPGILLWLSSVPIFPMGGSPKILLWLGSVPIFATSGIPNNRTLAGWCAHFYQEWQSQKSYFGWVVCPFCPWVAVPGILLWLGSVCPIFHMSGIPEILLWLTSVYPFSPWVTTPGILLWLGSVPVFATSGSPKYRTMAR